MTKHIILPIKTWAYRYGVNPEFLSNLNDLEKREFEDHYTNRIVYEFKKRIASECLEKVEHQYPKDWIQSIKHRWFPNWLLKFFPVEYQVIKIDVLALYPKISLPNKDHVVIAIIDPFSLVEPCDS